MDKRHLTARVTLALVVLLPSGVAAADVSDLKHSAKVKVTVQASSGIEKEVRSYVSRELRGLHDVTVTDSEPDYELSILAMEDEARSGNVVGVTLAYLCTEPSDPTFFTFIGKANQIGDKELNSLSRLFVKDHFTLCGFQLQTGARSDLNELVRRVVANFDSDMLEPARKSWQEMLDKMKEQPSSRTGP
jgi:hypothetical protein